MAEDLCGAAHPEHPEVSCDKPLPCYHFHASRVTGDAWGEQPAPPKRGRDPKSRLKVDQMAARAATKRTVAVEDAPQAADLARAEQEWVDAALVTFRGFLKDRTAPFTTPEDLWPLLDAPREMRQMVHVVRAALRRGWIEETAATRLTGTYRTRDGVEFQMNKLVPVYVSRITPLA